MERLPRAVAARQRQRRGLADMADAERVDEALQRNLAPRLDRAEQIAHRGLAVALDLLELESSRCAPRSVKMSAGSLTQPFVEEELDLLLAEALDVEGAARHEMPQVLDLLERTGELAGAAGARALLAGRGFLAHHLGVQRARAFLREIDMAWRPSAACRARRRPPAGSRRRRAGSSTVSPIRISRPSRICSPSLPMPLM